MIKQQSADIQIINFEILMSCRGFVRVVAAYRGFQPAEGYAGVPGYLYMAGYHTLPAVLVSHGRRNGQRHDAARQTTAR